MTKTIIRADNGRERKQTIVEYDEARKLINVLERKNIPYFAMHFGEDGFASASEGFGTEWCREIKKIHNNRLPRIEDFC